MTTETERRLRAVRRAIREYHETRDTDAGHMPAMRARAAVVDVMRECDDAISDALHALAAEAEDADAESRWLACDAQLVACDGGCRRVLQPRRVVEDHDDSWCRACVEREERAVATAYDDEIQRGTRRPRRAMRLGQE